MPGLRAVVVISCHFFSTACVMGIPPEVTQGLSSSIQALSLSLRWMLWNSFLALIPLGLSLWLFSPRLDPQNGALQNANPQNANPQNGKKKEKRRSLIWWIALIVGVAFLPNAPYVLTDVIHLVRFARQNVPVWMISFVMIPEYFLFILLGTEAYTLSLIGAGEYLRRQGAGRWVRPMEWSLHAVCAFGIYLGRFPRFNSWDLLTNPAEILRFIVSEMWRFKPAVTMVALFAVIVAVYWLLKHVTFALRLYLRSPDYRKSIKPF